VRGRPDDGESWPDVGLTSLGRFDTHISRAFGRARTPLWVTEYAESRPHVSNAQLARDVRQAVALASRVPAVRMFIWFMLQNHRGEPWQSGLVGSDAFASFRSAASTLDPRNGRVVWPRGNRPLVVRVAARELQLRARAWEDVAVTYTLTSCGSARSLTGGTARMQRNGWVRVVVQTGNVPPLKLVIVLTNAAGRQVERRFDVVDGATRLCG
jgi:hypothetical protein